MLRILLVLNEYQVTSNTIDFGYQIARLSKSSLVALFLKLPDQAFDNGAEYYSNSSKNGSTATTHKKKIQNGVDFFFSACARRGVQGNILMQGQGARERYLPVEEVIDESRFADLIIIDPAISFASKDGSFSAHFVKEIAATSECPVIVAPASIDSLEETIFCYDGSRSSIAAIKQFTYLLPEVCKNKLTVLEVASNGDLVDKKDQLTTWLKTHYCDIEFHLLYGNPTSELLKYFLSKDNLIVVLGSYGRSMVSQLFKRSSAELLVHVVNLPLFITHQ